MSRPSLRHGLPYGWWRNDEFWFTVAAAISVGGLAVLWACLAVAWWLR